MTPTSLPDATTRKMAQEVAELRRQVDTMLRSMRATQLGNSSIENGALVVRDEFGNIRDIYGRQDDGTFGSSHQNAPTPPPRPNTPHLTPIAAGFRVEWNGEFISARPLDFSYIEIHVGENPNFIVSDSTLVGTMSEKGSWIAAPFPSGNTYYVLFIAVNTSGLESEPSLINQVQPTQVVAQAVLDGIVTDVALANDAVTAAKIAVDAVDGTKIQDNSISSPLIVADAIQTLHIATGAVSANEIAANAITADKVAANAIQADNIAANAIEAGHIQSGAVTAAKLEAEMILTSRIIVGDPIGGNVGLDPIAGFEAFSPEGQRTVHISPASGNITAVGTFASGFSGERIVILTDGTQRFYQADGVNYAEIANISDDFYVTGPLNPDGRAGRLNLSPISASMHYGRDDEVPNDLRGEIVMHDRRIRITSPMIEFNVNEKLDNPFGGAQRVTFSAIDSDGDPHSLAYLHYQPSRGSNDDRPALVGNTVGLVFMGGGGIAARLQVRHATGDWDNWLNVHAGGFAQESSETVKTDIEDARAVVDPLEAIKNARARKFRYTDSPYEDDTKIGVLAEELPDVLITQYPGEDGKYIDLATQIGVLWGAFNQTLDQEVRSVTGSVNIPNGNYNEPDELIVDVTWDEEPLEVPSDVTALALVGMPTAMGKVRCRYVPGSATLTGCQIRVSFKGFATVTGQLPLVIETWGRYVWTPPYVPPEE